jgi:hypothetical protein
MDDAVAGFVPKLPLMPAGQPEVASVTAELNPFTAVTATVEVPVDPTVAVAAVALIVKLGAAFTVSAMLVLADNAPLVPFNASV